MKKEISPVVAAIVIVCVMSVLATVAYIATNRVETPAKPPPPSGPPAGAPAMKMPAPAKGAAKH
jgi:hypothetical protein